MKNWKSIGMLAIALAGFILLLTPMPASAQSCALCYTQAASSGARSEEHTSELQSLRHLVCRLLLDTATTEIYTLSLHDALPISGFILLLTPMPASAQSCALCYTQAASSGARMIQALKSGIIVLIAPPTLMSLGVVFVCYRKRNQTMKDDGDRK